MEVIQNKLMHSDFEPFPSSREKILSRSLTALGLQFLTFIISKTEAKDQDFSWCTSLLLGLSSGQSAPKQGYDRFLGFYLIVYLPFLLSVWRMYLDKPKKNVA